jgi:hypothetical protein
VSAAVEGAKAVVDGKLTPYNYNCKKADLCFVYNNIFFTYAVDDYMKMQQIKGENSPNSLAMCSSDLRNLEILINLEL